MAPNEPLLALLGFLAAVVVALVDGRNAVSWAALAAAVALAPSVASTYTADAAFLVLLAGIAAAAAGPLARLTARRVRWIAGVDPVVPVVAGGEPLFGPRSVRVTAAAAVLPAASWVSFNVPLGTATTVSGVLFPAALIWGCGAMRLLAARTLVDVATGIAVVGIAAAAGWFLSGGEDAFSGAAAAVALAVGAAVTAGWLAGRHAGPAAQASA